MLVTVYRMRSGGHRLAGSDPMLRHGVLGRLTFAPSPLDSYGPRMEAHLLDRAGNDLIWPLHYARVLRIDGVMHIAGREYAARSNVKGNVHILAQSWLCEFRPGDAAPYLARVHVETIPGFSPEDDERLD